MNIFHMIRIQNIHILDGVFETKLINTAKDVLKKYKRGMNLIFPNIITIENALLNSFIKD